MLQSTFKKLRHGECLNLFNRRQKMFVKIQINRKVDFVCWMRYVSKDRRNWVCLNEYLSLHDVANLLYDIHNENNI